MSSRNKVDPYQTLNVSEDASWEEIRQAYLLAHRTYRPGSLVLHSVVSEKNRQEMVREIDLAYRLLAESENSPNQDLSAGHIGDTVSPSSPTAQHDSSSPTQVPGLPARLFSLIFPCLLTSPTGSWKRKIRERLLFRGRHYVQGLCPFCEFPNMLPSITPSGNAIVRRLRELLLIGRVRCQQCGQRLPMETSPEDELTWRPEVSLMSPSSTFDDDRNFLNQLRRREKSEKRRRKETDQSLLPFDWDSATMADLTEFESQH